MYILKELITAFILPPGFFILLLFAAATLLFTLKRRWTGAALLVLGLLMWGLSVTPITDVLLAGLIRDIRSEEAIPRGDVIVLLGGGVEDRMLDMSGKPGILNAPMLTRLVTAVRLSRRLQVPIIVSGGRAPDSRVAEAAAAKQYMLDLGVPAEKIITETNSTNTFENAVNVKTICRHRGFSRPVLVTSIYHLKRALWSFEKNDLTCTPFANGLASLPASGYTWRHFLPGSFDAAADYLHEYIGLFYYSWRFGD
jgi:uncharacterized SAM-binding protein YcdF (DUF218 family)